MPDAESFIAAIASAPADDLPRLVYADWLDENGDPARAAFIRDHVALAKLRTGTDDYKTLFRRCADTLRANLPAWIQPACDAFGQPAEWKPGKAVGGRFAIRLQATDAGFPFQHIEYNRGFMDQVTLRLPNVKNPMAVDELFRLNPITRLTASLLMGASAWEAMASPRMSSLRSLHIAMGFPETADAAFASPFLERVVRLDLDTTPLVERLVRSPMARRIGELCIEHDLESIRLLQEFPLDDRLYQLQVKSVNRLNMALPAHYTEQADLWSAISRVSFRPTLKRLDVTRCGMTDDGLAAFARGEEWVRLQGLKLGGNLFGDRGWADFCRGWRTPELTYLDASRNRLTDAGAEMLARSGMLKTLRVIDLRGNRIAGRGAVALSRAVAEGKVNRLLLAGNPVGKREAATVKGLLGERSDLA